VRRWSDRASLSAVVLCVAVGIAGCAGGRAAPPDREPQAVAPAGLEQAASAGDPPGRAVASPAAPAAPFDRALSARLLGEAEAHRARGETAPAAEAYRAAALVWPDNEAAWQGLVAMAEAGDDPQARQAARFVLDRLYLFPSDALAVQREYRAALLGFVEEARTDPDANPLTVTYARVLADYYAFRYAERGVYSPPEGYGNLRWTDLPAAAISSAILLGYGGNLIGGIVQ
jgi:hypothetical protein